MKKLITIMMTAVMAFGMMTGCGNDRENTNNISVAESAEKILKATEIVAELTEATDNNIDIVYSAYSTDFVEEYKVYMCASRATCEEVALFKAKDSDSTEKVKDMVLQRVNDLIDETENYNPKEMPKLESPLVLVKDNYVLLVLADDTAPAEKAFRELFK